MKRQEINKNIVEDTVMSKRKKKFKNQKTKHIMENLNVTTTASTSTTAATEATPSKLLGMLQADHTTTRNKRAGNFNLRLRSAFNADLQVETEKLLKLETQKLEMSDFAPNDSTSLRVVDPSFNETKWSREYNNLTLAIKLQKEVVQNINDNIADLF